MNASAYISVQKFFERYWSPRMNNILEIGSYNVYGSIRDHQPKNSKWTGVDLGMSGLRSKIVLEKRQHSKQRLTCSCIFERCVTKV